MSRFYGSLEGSAKTATTRRGTANHPCKAHVRTWTHGVEILSDVNSATDREYFAVYATGGSNRPDLTRLIATVGIDESGNVSVQHVESAEDRALSITAVYGDKPYEVPHVKA